MTIAQQAKDTIKLGITMLTVGLLVVGFLSLKPDTYRRHVHVYNAHHVMHHRTGMPCAEDQIQVWVDTPTLAMCVNQDEYNAQVILRWELEQRRGA